MSFRLFSLLILSSLILGGCGKYMPKLDKVLPDQRQEYKKSKSLPDLEVPPDLTTENIDDSLSVPELDTDGSASFSTYQERVARQKENRQYTGTSDASSMAELSGEQLIIVSGSSSDTWITLQEFWSNLGYTLDLNDEELGIMETNWNGDTNSQKRDKYKVFIEPAENDGQIAIYLSHEGETFTQNAWAKRGRDLPLEQSMTTRIKKSFGIAAAPSNSVTTATRTRSQAPDIIRTKLLNADDGGIYLSANRSIDTIWPRVGTFLNNASDISVTEEDMSNGIYYITYLDNEGKKKGIVSKLAFWKKDNNKFQISLTGAGEKTEIIVLDDDGEMENSGTAEQILRRIRSSL